MKLARRSVILAAVLVLSAAACAQPPPPPAPNPVGAAGQFIVQCHGPVKSAAFDPVVFPGQAVAGHNHEFYANQSTNPDSTYASMVAAPTACDNTADTAGYWHPTLYYNGARVPVPKSTFYYIGNGGDYTIPAGLKMIAGDSHATSPQPKSVVYYGCGNGSGVSGLTSPPFCSSGDFTVHVEFPDCWNGHNLDSADHKSHVAYSPCPSGYVKIPQLVARFQWTGFHPDPAGLTLSSGSMNTMHADFWNAWSERKLDAIIKGCISDTPHECSADEATQIGNAA